MIDEDLVRSACRLPESGGWGGGGEGGGGRWSVGGLMGDGSFVL
jgi:hypothetical protein